MENEKKEEKKVKKRVSKKGVILSLAAIALVTAGGIHVYDTYLAPLPNYDEELQSLLPTEVIPEGKEYEMVDDPADADFDVLEIVDWPVYTDGEIHEIIYDEDEDNRYSLEFQRLEVNNYGIKSLDVPAAFTRNGEEPLKMPGIEKPNYEEIDPNTLIDNSEAYYYEGVESTDHLSRYIYNVGQFQMWKSNPFELEGDVVDWENFKRYSCGSELYKAGGLVVENSFEQTTTEQGYPAAVCKVILPDVYDPEPDPKKVVYIESTIYAWYADGCLNYGLIGLKEPVRGDLGKYMFIRSVEGIPAEEAE